MDDNSEVPATDSPQQRFRRDAVIAGLVVAVFGLVVAFWPEIQCPPSRGPECGAYSFVMIITMPIGGLIGVIGLIMMATGGKGRESENSATEAPADGNGHIPPERRSEFPNYNEKTDDK